jgi:AcrR family transcriptional regulator
MSDEIGGGWARPAHQHRSRDQRDRLLRAGMHVFAQKGFWQTHVVDIAKAAGCSVGSFYRRFEDKESLFFALQEFMHQRAHENIRAFFDDPARADETFTEMFERLMSNTLRAVRGISGYYRALYEMSLRGYPVWPRMRELEAYQGRRIAKLAAARGATMPAAELALSAQLITRMVNGQIISVVLHGPGPYEADDPRFVQELARICVGHLGLENLPPKRQGAD